MEGYPRSLPDQTLESYWGEIERIYYQNGRMGKSPLDEAVEWLLDKKKSSGEEIYLSDVRFVCDKYDHYHYTMTSGERFWEIFDDCYSLVKDGVSEDELVIIDYFAAGNADLIAGFLTRWLEKDSANNIENDEILCDVISLAGPQFGKLLAKSWIARNMPSKEYALHIFHSIKNKNNSIDFLETWFRNVANPTKLSIEDVCSVLRDCSSLNICYMQQIPFLKYWLDNALTEANKDDFWKIIDDEGIGHGIKRQIALWRYGKGKLDIDKPDHLGFIHIIGRVGGVDPSFKALVRNYIEFFKLEPEELFAIARDMGLTGAVVYAISSSVENSSNKVDEDFILETLKLAKNDEERFCIIEACAKNLSDDLNRDGFYKMLDFVESDEKKVNLTNVWLENKPNIAKEDFLYVMNKCVLPHITKLASKDIAEDFLEVAREIKIESNRVEFLTRVFVEKSWASSESGKDSDDIFEMVVKVFNEDPPLLNKYDPSIMMKIALASGSTPRMPELSVALYPTNEYLQAEYVGFFVLNRHPIPRKDFLNFVRSLHDNDLALDFLSPQYFCFTSPLESKEIMDVACDRMHSRYKSLAGVFEGKMAKDFLSDKGLEAAKKYFDNLDKISLSGLMSFYDIKNQFIDFVEMLKPEILDEVRGNFRFKSNKCYLIPIENGKLEVLLGISLPRSAALCDVFNEARGEAPDVDFKACEINFAGMEKIYDEDKRKELNDEFRRLLQSDKASPDKVGAFFKDLLVLEDDISPLNAGKLADIFNSNKNEFALIFSQEGSLEQFRNIITTLGDGCVANIGNHFDVALTRILIKDQELAVLYSAFVSDVVEPFLAQGEDKLDHDKGNKFNILKGRGVRDCSLVPEQFVSAVAQRFINKEDKRVVNPWVFFKENNASTSDDEMGYYAEVFLEEHADDFDKQSAKFVAMSILEKRAPELLAHSSMAEDCKWYADIKQKVAAKKAEAEAETKGEVEELDYKVAKDEVVSQAAHPATKEPEKAPTSGKAVPVSNRLIVEGKSLSPKHKEAVKLGGRKALERIKLSMVDDDLDDTEELMVKGSAVKPNPPSKMQGKQGRNTVKVAAKNGVELDF